MNITDTSLQYLSKCQTIKLYNCKGITINGLRHLDGCPFVEIYNCPNIINNNNNRYTYSFGKIVNTRDIYSLSYF